MGCQNRQQGAGTIGAMAEKFANTQYHRGGGEKDVVVRLVLMFFLSLVGLGLGDRNIVFHLFVVEIAYFPEVVDMFISKHSNITCERY
jgi:hypothetical protein